MPALSWNLHWTLTCKQWFTFWEIVINDFYESWLVKKISCWNCFTCIKVDWWVTSFVCTSMCKIMLSDYNFLAHTTSGIVSYTWPDDTELSWEVNRHVGQPMIAVRDKAAWLALPAEGSMTSSCSHRLNRIQFVYLDEICFNFTKSC